MHVRILRMCVTRSFTDSSSCPMHFYATLIRRARIPVRQVSHAPFTHRTRLFCLSRREFTDQRCTQGRYMESVCDSRKSRNIHLLIMISILTRVAYTYISLKYHDKQRKQRKSLCDFCILQNHTISIAK